MHFDPLPDGARRYRLATCHGHEWLSGYDVFVVVISPNAADELIERMGILSAARAKDGAAYEVRFQEDAGEYFGTDFGGYDDTEEPPPPIGDASKTEESICIVHMTEVAWSTFAMEGDEGRRIYTESIPRSDLLEIAGTPLLSRRR